MKSEIQDLLELCKNQGISQNELQTAFEETIAESYTTWIHKDALPSNISIIVDVKKGQFRVLESEKDITPDGFVQHAEKSIRKVLIAKIKANFTTPNQTYTAPTNIPLTSQPQTSTFAKNINLNGLVSIIFWFYNGGYVVMLLLVILGLSSQGDQILNILSEFLSANIMQIFLTLILFFTPLISILLVLNKNIVQAENKTSKVLLLFELPIVLISFYALNILSNAAPFVWILICSLLLAPVMWILSGSTLINENSQNIRLKFVTMIATTILMLATGYISLLLSFFIPPLIGFTARGAADLVLNSLTNGDILELIVMLIPFLLMALFYGIFIVGFAALILTPYFITYKMFRKLTEIARDLIRTTPVKTVQTTIFTTIAVIFMATVLSNVTMPGPTLLSQLNTYHQATSFEDKFLIAQSLQNKKEELRKAIQNPTYDYQKYPLAKDDTMIADAYQQSLGVSPTLSKGIEALFDAVAFPITYQGSRSFYTNYYSQAFKDIYGEEYYTSSYPSSSPTLVKNVAVNSRTATVQTVLAERFAKITIEEQYRNKAYTNQEVIYEFTLPQYSVMTDLKLGNNLKFQGLIAPRGAAERVFNQEVNRGRDPALLEQTGPRHYRLRVFPIPPANSTQNNSSLLKVSYTYLTPFTDKGYSLPSFTKKQNVDDADLNFLLTFNNGQPQLAKDYITINKEQILQKICAASNDQSPIQTTEYELSFSPCTSTQATGKLIVLYDVSHRKELKNTSWDKVVAWLKEIKPITSEIEIYLVNEQLSKKYSYEEAIALSSLPLFGSKLSFSSLTQIPSNAQKIVLITSLNDGAVYKDIISSAPKDKLFVLSESGFPALQQSDFISALQKNVIFIDRFDQITNTKSDNSLLASGVSWELQRRPISNNTQNTTIQERVVLPVAPEPTTRSSPTNFGGTALVTRPEVNDLDALGTHASITRDIITYGSTNIQTTYIDQLHKKAESAYVVTAYSSLIALINQQQLQNLQYESERWDKYQSQTTTPSRVTELPQAAPYGMNSGPDFGFLGGGFVGSSSNSVTLSEDNSNIGAIQSPLKATYGFNSIDNALSGIFNLFLFGNALLLGFAAFIFAIKKVKNRNNK